MLQITDLHTYYGNSHTLRGVSLELPAGTSLGLLGRNGMGKTTLIRSLMGYVRAASGQVRWEGSDVTNRAPERTARLGIGYVPEGRGIFPNLSVRENLVMTARRGVDGRNDWTYDRVLTTFPRLTERLGHGGQQLSGGEQQMLAIGRALMSNPRVLLMDEPSEGLAPQIVAEVMATIRQLKEQGLSILLVEQNAKLAFDVADDIVILNSGRVVLAATAAALVRDKVDLHQHLGIY